MMVRLLLALLTLPALYVAGLWLSTPDSSPLAREAPVRTSYMRLQAGSQGLPEDAFSVRETPLDQISPLLVCAVVKGEDSGFFRHHGVEWSAFRGALLGWLQGAGLRGGSTLTQQLARNLYLSPERTVHRKLRELLIARELEATLDKRRILELYLNTVEWGEGVWGVTNASQHYFGKAPSELDAFEASFLAGLLAAPRQPLVGGNAKRACAVQSRVLDQMRNSGLLEKREYQREFLRIQALCARLEQGDPFNESLIMLQVSIGKPAEWPLRSRTMDTILHEECGWKLELDTVATYREMRRHVH